MTGHEAVPDTEEWCWTWGDTAKRLRKKSYSIWECSPYNPETGRYSLRSESDEPPESNDKVAPPWKTEEPDSEASERQNLFKFPQVNDVLDPDKVLYRITSDPEIYFGTPIIRGMRVAVQHVTGMLAAGQSVESILDQYEFLEPEDIQACLVFANRLVSEWDILKEAVEFTAAAPDDDEDWWRRAPKRCVT